MPSPLKSSFWLFAACLAIVSGCSHQQMYNAVQQNRLSHCQEVTDEQTSLECQQQHAMPWKEYEQRRQSLKNSEQ